MKNEEQLIISYVPFLLPQDIGEDAQAQQTMKYIEELPQGEVFGCAWFVDDKNELVPYLIVDDAEKLAEHLLFWSENSPQDWFRFHWAKKGEEYAIGLVPEVGKTVERFKIGYQLRTGYPYPRRSKITVYFKPLHFQASRPDLVFNQEKFKVNLLDRRTMGEINESISDRAVFLGEFYAEPNSKMLEKLF